MKRKILVVDIGGTHVKLLMSPRDEREFPSGQRMGPKQFVARFKENVRGWKFDRASIGFPVPVRNGRITRNPKHLGKGWIGFNTSACDQRRSHASARQLPWRRTHALFGTRNRPGLGSGLGEDFDAA